MEDQKTKLATKLKAAHNVLVTVKNNPSVDQLAAAISLTLILNKLDKHATTVFSGAIPPVIEFLQPERTIEKDTNSLQDFIIALDKSKADKLRYKLEDNYVKIYITPYHASIDESDLVFEQGEVNVDLVIALGVTQREELDNAITAHGHILHDAAIATINTLQASTVGSINVADNTSSSICEMIVPLIDTLKPEGLIDVQVANALLTGIVSETARFSNEKTTSVTMNTGSRLLASGANQQLVTAQLASDGNNGALQQFTKIDTPPATEPPKTPEEPQKPTDNHVTFEVQHAPDPEVLQSQAPKTEEAPDPNSLTQVHIDEQGDLKTLADKVAEETAKTPSADPATPGTDNYKLVIEPSDLSQELKDKVITPPAGVPTMPDLPGSPQTSGPMVDPSNPTATVEAPPEPAAETTTTDTSSAPDIDAVREQVNAALTDAQPPANPMFDHDISGSSSEPVVSAPFDPSPTPPAEEQPVVSDSSTTPPPPPVPPPFSPQI